MGELNRAPAFAGLAALIALSTLSVGALAKTGAAGTHPTAAASKAAAAKSGTTGNPAKAGTSTTVATPTPTPEGRTRLTEPHEFDFEELRERDAVFMSLVSGVGRFLGALLWPAVAIVGLVLGSRAVQRLSASQTDPNPAPAAAPAPHAVSANAQFSVPAADLLRANTAAGDVLAQFQALFPAGGAQPIPSVIEMLGSPLPPAAPPALVDAREVVERYSERVFGGMLASQYALLAAAATRMLTYGEVASIFSDAQQAGYSATMATWLDFLVRTGLLQSVAAGATATTVVRATDLGRMFLGWFDGQGYTKQIFERFGRGM